MTVLAETFWVWFFVVLVAIGIVMVLTDQRISRGQRRAGPLNAEPKKVAGLSETSWDQTAIERSLEARPEAVAIMLRDLATSIDLDHRSTPAAGPGDRGEVERLVSLIEAHVELTPGPGRSPQHAEAPSQRKV